MKILQVVPTYFPATRYGGPVHAVHGLSRALVRMGCEVHVATTNVDGPGESNVPLEEPAVLDGVRVHYFRSGLVRRLYHSPGMGRFLRSTAGDYALVHLHSVFLWPTLAAGRAARRADVPYVVSPRGMLVRELIERRSAWAKRIWIALFERRTLERAAAVHLTSDVERGELLALGVVPRATFVVPNGVDSAAVAPAPAPAGEGPVLYLGRINWKKGLDRLIESLREVPGRQLVIAGNDEEGLTPQLRALAQRCGVAERVQFAGYVEGEAKRAQLRQAAVLVLPSISENFGNAALEALAQGCPVVVTPGVGLAAAVQESGAGVVTSGDPPALARAIRSLTEDPARHAAAGAAALALVRRRYEWDRVAAEMMHHYEMVVRDARRA